MEVCDICTWVGKKPERMHSELLIMANSRERSFNFLSCVCLCHLQIYLRILNSIKVL